MIEKIWTATLDESAQKRMGITASSVMFADVILREKTRNFVFLMYNGIPVECVGGNLSHSNPQDIRITPEITNAISDLLRGKSLWAL